MSAFCEKIDGPVDDIAIDSRVVCHHAELDEPVPFYAQDDPPIIWLGTEQSFCEFSIEDPEDVERRYAPGYASSGDWISVEFLANAVALDRAGDLRAALSIIYRRTDEMIKLGLVPLIGEELSSIPAEEMGTDVLLGLLTATLPVKSQLSSRPALFKSTRKLIKARGHYERGILDGLE